MLTSKQKNKRKNTKVVRIDKELHRELKFAALHYEVAMSTLLNDAIELCLDNSYIDIFDEYRQAKSC